MNRILSFSAPFGSAYTGLSLTYTVYDSAHATVTSGAMVEWPAGSGLYDAFPSVLKTLAGKIVSSAPTGLDPYVLEIQPTS